MSSTNDISSLITARRLIIADQEFQAERKGKKVIHTDAREAMEQDQVLLSGETPQAEKTGESQPENAPIVGIDIDLSGLAAKFKQVQAQAIPAQQQLTDLAAQRITLEAQIKEEIAIQVKYTQLGKVDGLVVNSPNQAETDRYSFEFESAYALKIVDKWSGKYTRVWGDPHVDTSDEEGEYNGEFSDLKKSNINTTMMLQDGSQVSFTALDNGIIEKVDIFKGQQHLSGIGAGSKDYKAENALFASAVDTNTSASAVPMGDTVFAGGDGNDWYDSVGRLVWGKTTSAPVLSKPSAILEMSYRRTLTQQISITAAGIKA